MPPPKQIKTPIHRRWELYAPIHWYDEWGKERTKWVNIGTAYSKDEEHKQVHIYLDALPRRGVIVGHTSKKYKKTVGQRIDEKKKNWKEKYTENKNWADTLNIGEELAEDDGAIYES